MIHIEEITPTELVPGFFGRFLHGENSTLAYWQIRKGSSMPEHAHVHEQVTFIQKGELEMTIGGEKLLFTAGTTQVIHSNVPHSAIAKQDSIVIDFFSPARDDYR